MVICCYHDVLESQIYTVFTTRHREGIQGTHFLRFHYSLGRVCKILFDLRKTLSFSCT
jgi:hypothetical protein